MHNTDQIDLASIDGLLSGSVEALGGKLASLCFDQKDILWQAPWRNEQLDAVIPPMVRQMAGEWIALPFGCVDIDDELFYFDAPHGLPANQHWKLDQVSQSEVIMGFEWPESYPLSHATRRILFLPEGIVKFQLSVTARRPCRLPVGLHPVFPMGGNAGPLQIISKSSGIVYPRPTEPNCSYLTAGAIFPSLQQVPTEDNDILDISNLPLTKCTEEIVQLIDTQGEMHLHWPQRNLTVLLSWDRKQLPGCLLWVSNGGRDYAPWNGRNFSLGVEPVCSAWDCGRFSLQPNPLNRLGQNTALDISPLYPLDLTWQITCINE